MQIKIASETAMNEGETGKVIVRKNAAYYRSVKWQCSYVTF